MNQDDGLWMRPEDEYKEINNELVVPVYRDFCTALSLPFHFWDELPEEWIDSDISLDEIPLQTEAMNLFNTLKPEYIVFRNRVVKFQFTSWDGFTYRTWPVQDFLDQTSEELFYLRNVERRFATTASMLALVVAVLPVLAAVLLLTNRAIAGTFADLCLISAIATGAVLYSVILRRIKNVPKRIIDDGRLRNVFDRITKLREQLDTIRGSRHNPLSFMREMRTGRLILEELQSTMSPAEIADLVRRVMMRK